MQPIDSPARQRADARLLDILLEEQFGNLGVAVTARLDSHPEGRQPSSHSRWLAAALLLLGLAVVAGSYLVRGTPGPRFALPPQHPAPGSKLIEPRDATHFRELLQQATALRVTHQVIVGAHRVVTLDGSADMLDMQPWPSDQRIAGDDLLVWRTAILNSMATRGEWNGPSTVLNVEFALPDRQLVRCYVELAGDQSRWAVGDERPLVPDAALLALLERAHADLVERQRLALGRVESAAELAALPADSARVDCPAPTDGHLAAALQRLPMLRTLCVRGDFRAGLLGELQALPLRALELDGAGLDADMIAELAGIKTLQALTLRRCTGLDGAGVRVLGRLRELAVLRCIDTALGSEGLQGLSSLPGLREFGLRGRELPPRALEALLPTKLARLQLVDVPVTGDDLSVLAGLPSLRELVLVTATEDADLIGIAKLRGLQQLKLRNAENANGSEVTAEAMAALRQQLPGCAIDWQAYARYFDTALSFEY